MPAARGSHSRPGVPDAVMEETAAQETAVQLTGNTITWADNKHVESPRLKTGLGSGCLGLLEAARRE